MSYKRKIPFVISRINLVALAFIGDVYVWNNRIAIRINDHAGKLYQVFLRRLCERAKAGEQTQKD
jgi:hypothetical protein